MKKLFLAVILFSISFLYALKSQWLRYPSISPDGGTIVFSYQSNLYTINSGDGEAKPLIINGAQD